jgi:hypothetical protein
MEGNCFIIKGGYKDKVAIKVKQQLRRGWLSHRFVDI